MGTFVLPVCCKRAELTLLWRFYRLVCTSSSPYQTITLMSTDSSEPRDKSDQEEQWESFRDLLNEQSDWPIDYLFKFIVPKAGLESMKEVFDGHEIVVRASTRGNYLSITATVPVASADEVIRVYQEAGKVPGVVSL